ncbi:MAG: polysaccharide biosynthesis C-terminal domain-containing protein, partial [Treponema sp.]|nr:polysaccharide biosynthesis C-terminal domain-containing protein [Treponema sp.]
MRDNTTDMTVGNPVRHLLMFALPALVGNQFQQLYNLADSIIVGKFVGADALAAVGSTASITFMFFALCNGIGNGGGIIASQFYGAHDEEKVKGCIVNTGLIMLVVPVLFGTIGFVSAPALLALLSTPPEILPDAAMYVRFMCAGLIFVSLYNYLSAMLRALGDSRSPLYFLILSTIINVVLDIVFVYVCKMGIRGAAIAT